VCHLHRRPVVVSMRGRTSETETEGGGVEVEDDDGEVDDDGLEFKDGGGVLEVDGGVLRARGQRATCLRLMAAWS
jgi:hypothetical protein